jgi:hypothetical protein
VANEIVRCPYCVLGDRFRPMLQRPSWFVCEQCGHVVILDDPDFKWSCRRCTEKSLTSDPSRQIVALSEKHDYCRKAVW